MSDPIRVMFFCLGNICRSPLAEALFRYHSQERGLTDRLHIESSGTSAWHVGEAPDMGSQRVARQRLGLDISDQRAQQLTRDHVNTFEVLVAMDRSNLQIAEDYAQGFKVIHLLRDFEPGPAKGANVPDPWGGGDDRFEEVYSIVNRCTERLLDYIVDEFDLD